jgi:hypothetical protein
MKVINELSIDLNVNVKIIIFKFNYIKLVNLKIY